MRLLELFSGTHSIGKVAKKLDIEVISLDRDLPHLEGSDPNLHIKEDILTWDYKQYPADYFDIVTASPVCAFWSNIRCMWIGRPCKSIQPNGEKVTMKDLENDIDKYGKPMVDKVFEILDYFKPKIWWIENPQTGKMKRYINKIRPNIKYYDVDYCKYGFSYQKRTRFWTNLENLEMKKCKKDCNSIVKEGKRSYHSSTLLASENVRKAKTGKKQKELWGKKDRYRIPEELCKYLLNSSLKQINKINKIKPCSKIKEMSKDKKEITPNDLMKSIAYHYTDTLKGDYTMLSMEPLTQDEKYVYLPLKDYYNKFEKKCKKLDDEFKQTGKRGVLISSGEIHQMVYFSEFQALASFDFTNNCQIRGKDKKLTDKLFSIIGKLPGIIFC